MEFVYPNTILLFPPYPTLSYPRHGNTAEGNAREGRGAGARRGPSPPGPAERARRCASSNHSSYPGSPDCRTPEDIRPEASRSPSAPLHSSTHEVIPLTLIVLLISFYKLNLDLSCPFLVLSSKGTRMRLCGRRP